MLAVVLAASLTGCADDLPDLSEDEARACASLVDALPDPLAGQSLTERGDRTASWDGIELTCGVARPEGYDEYAPCLQVRRVGWFVPQADLEDPSTDATVTALTTAPYVALHVPAELRSAGVDGMLAELAGPLRAELGAGDPCR